MDELRNKVTEQFSRLQMLMSRSSFHGFLRGARSPMRGQGRVLAILKLKPEISQKELTYLLGMSKQSIAELLSKLEKNELIAREASESDTRSKIIKLTEKGGKAAEDADNSATGPESVLSCLENEELETLSAYLERIIQRYEEQFPNTEYAKRRKTMDAFVSQHGNGRNDENGEPSGERSGRFPGWPKKGSGGCGRNHY